VPVTLTHRQYHVLINGTAVGVTADFVLNASLDNLTRVCDITLASAPAVAPDEGDDVEVWLVDMGDPDATDDQEALPVFGGKVNTVEVIRSPWSLVLRCTDQLELLRRVPEGDHDLSGMTDGEAVMHILDSCNITYDPADIADMGYTFDAALELNWLANTTGGQVIQEINQVFGTALMTIGNNRVVRFRVELPPVDGTGSYRTYSRADGDQDSDWYMHGQSKGERDAIQNVWFVRGVSYPCGTDDECTCSPWARATQGNPQLGSRRVKTVRQEFSSDLIQDEGLAEFVVRMMMRRYNRLQFSAVVDVDYDPNMQPGRKVTLTDDTYGISAVDLYGTVETLDVSGLRMSLQVMVGAPGAEGTVTHDVEKVCNETQTGVGTDPGIFEPPDFDFPPIEPPTLTGLGELALPELVLIGGTDDPEDEAGGPGAGPVEAVWENVVGGDDFTINQNDLRAEELLNPVARTTNTIEATGGMPKSYVVSWIFRAQNSGILGDNIEVLAEDANDVNSYHFWLSFFQNSTGIYFLNGADYEGYGSGIGNDFGDPAPTATDISVQIEWDRPTQTFTVTVEGGTGSPFTEDIPTASGVSLGMTSGEVRFVAIANNGSAGDYSEVRDFTWQVLE
jgi:hypothetical protein